MHEDQLDLLTLTERTVSSCRSFAVQFSDRIHVCSRVEGE
jgi:hypothetical protein